MNKPFKIRLHILSPTHIGCDEAYEPTSFVIDEVRKKLIEFLPFDFINSLNEKEKEEFNRAVLSDKLLDIFKAVRRYYKLELKGREISVSDYLLDHYKKILAQNKVDNKTLINQFNIQKTAYNSITNSPYIPGSSLKGALRTAYLSM